MNSQTVNLNAKLPEILTALGTITLKNNSVEILNYVSGNYIAAAEDILSACDLIDVATGEVWRIPPPDGEHRIVKCLGDCADNSVIYINAVKGSEQPFPRLIKIDLKTKQYLWDVAISRVSKGRWSWAENEEYIFYTDNKNIFTHSKKTGKMVKKHVRKYEGRAWNPKFFAFGYLFEYHNGVIVADGWDKKNALTITGLNPLEDNMVWELSLGQKVKTVARKVMDNVLYLLCTSGKFYKIDMLTGNIISEIDTKQPSDSGLGFYDSADNLTACIRTKLKEEHFIVKYEPKTDKIVVENFSEIIPKGNILPDGIIQDNRLYWIGHSNVYVIDIENKKEISRIDIGNCIDQYLFLGDKLYITPIMIEENDRVLTQLG